MEDKQPCPHSPSGVHLKGGQTAAVTHATAAREFYAPLLPVIVELRRQGLSLRAIAAELDRRGIKTRQEWDHWSATQIRRVLARAGALEPHKPHTDAPH
jgi:hypothetical protein